MGNGVSNGRVQFGRGGAATMITPRQMFENPTRWLDVPHVLHNVLDGLMEDLFEGWYQHRNHVVCYECHGRPPVKIFDLLTGAPLRVVGAVMGTDGQVLMYWAALERPGEPPW